MPNEYEYAKFGAGYVRRVDVDHDWEEVPLDDHTIAENWILRQKLEAANSRGQRLTTKIIRSERNKIIAESLGITVDELAERLTDPKKNEGTTRRVSEEDFDTFAETIGMSGQEMRDRFSGKFWAENEPTEPANPTEPTG